MGGGTAFLAPELSLKQKTANYLKDRAHHPDLNGLIQATQDIISDEYKLIPDRETGKRKDGVYGGKMRDIV